jgi:RHS repeat-associated protein
LRFWDCRVTKGKVAYYYPFGMQMPGRGFTSGDGYRYGFNGQERDDEMKGSGNSYDFGARIYDSRIGKFLSTDRFASKYAFQSPYTFAGNTPIWAVDHNGDSIRVYTANINNFKNELQIKLGDQYSVEAKLIERAHGQSSYYVINVAQIGSGKPSVQSKAVFNYLSSYTGVDNDLNIAFSDAKFLKTKNRMLLTGEGSIQKVMRFKKTDPDRPKSWRYGQLQAIVNDRPGITVFSKRGLSLLNENTSLGGIDFMLMVLSKDKQQSLDLTGKYIDNLSDDSYKVNLKYLNSSGGSGKVKFKNKGTKGVSVKQKEKL